jgi:hypothetical protein
MPGVNLCEYTKRAPPLKSSFRTLRIASNADNVLQHRWENLKNMEARINKQKLPSAIHKLIKANLAIPLSGQSNKSYSFYVFAVHFPVHRQNISEQNLSGQIPIRGQNLYQGTKPIVRTNPVEGHTLSGQKLSAGQNMYGRRRRTKPVETKPFG